MKKKMRFLTCIFVVLPMLATYTYFNRSAYITKYDWKKQATKERLGGGIICFGENSAYTYQWPMITKEKEYKGIVFTMCWHENGSLFTGRQENWFYMYEWSLSASSPLS